MLAWSAGGDELIPWNLVVIAHLIARHVGGDGVLAWAMGDDCSFDCLYCRR